MRYLWGLTDFENSRSLRPNYGGEFEIDGLAKKVVKKDRLSSGTRRIIVELPLSVFGVAIIIGIFYGFIRLENWAAPDEDLGETYDSISRVRVFLE